MRLRTSSSIRGLRDLKTRSGRVDRAHVPYMAYMKISCLEMEKARRAKERHSAQTRIDNIDARVAELDAEKAALLVQLGERSGNGSIHRTSAARKDEPSTEVPVGHGFRIRY